MPRRISTHRAWTPAGASRHQVYDQAQRDPKAKAFYNSGAWVKLRLMKLRRSPLCETCKAAGRIEPAVLAHHILERRERSDVALDLDNLQSLCASCHSRLHSSPPQTA